jgi:hypothetical protein
MGVIASLLLGRDAGRLLDLVTGESDREQEMADRTLRSGEWCGSTPGRGRSPRPASGADPARRPLFPFGGFNAPLTPYVRSMSDVLPGYA